MWRCGDALRVEQDHAKMIKRSFIGKGIEFGRPRMKAC